MATSAPGPKAASVGSPGRSLPPDPPEALVGMGGTKVAKSFNRADIDGLPRV